MACSFAEWESSHSEVYSGQLRFYCSCGDPAGGIHPGKTCCFRIFEVLHDQLIYFFLRLSFRKEVLGGGSLWSGNNWYIPPQSNRVKISPGPKEFGFAKYPLLLVLVHGCN